MKQLASKPPSAVQWIRDAGEENPVI